VFYVAVRFAAKTELLTLLVEMISVYSGKHANKKKSLCGRRRGYVRSVLCRNNALWLVPSVYLSTL